MTETTWRLGVSRIGKVDGMTAAECFAVRGLAERFYAAGFDGYEPRDLRRGMIGWLARAAEARRWLAEKRAGRRGGRWTNGTAPTLLRAADCLSKAADFRTLWYHAGFELP